MDSTSQNRQIYPEFAARLPAQYPQNFVPYIISPNYIYPKITSSTSCTSVTTCRNIQPSQSPRSRKNMYLPIIDPITGKNVLEDCMLENTASGNKKTAHSDGTSCSDDAVSFAPKVAAAATSKDSGIHHLNECVNKDSPIIAPPDVFASNNVRDSLRNDEYAPEICNRLKAEEDSSSQKKPRIPLPIENKVETDGYTSVTTYRSIQPTQPPRSRKNMYLSIIDPITGKNILEDCMLENTASENKKTAHSDCTSRSDDAVLLAPVVAAAVASKDSGIRHLNEIINKDSPIIAPPDVFASNNVRDSLRNEYTPEICNRLKAEEDSSSQKKPTIPSPIENKVEINGLNVNNVQYLDIEQDAGYIETTSVKDLPHVSVDLKLKSTDTSGEGSVIEVTGNPASLKAVDTETHIISNNEDNAISNLFVKKETALSTSGDSSLTPILLDVSETSNRFSTTAGPMMVNTPLDKRTNISVAPERQKDKRSLPNVKETKHYNREFLLKLQTHPMSMKRLASLPNLNIIKNKAHLHKLNYGSKPASSCVTEKSITEQDNSLIPSCTSTNVVKPNGMQRSPHDRRKSKNVAFSSFLNPSVEFHKSEHSREPSHRDDASSSKDAVKLQKTEFTDSSVSSASIPYIEKLQSLLSCQDNNEEVIAWVKETLSEEDTNKPIFIRAFIPAMLKQSVTGAGCICFEILKHRHPLLVKFIAKKPDLELEALYALQSLFSERRGFLNEIFRFLIDHKIISEDTFEKWKVYNQSAERYYKCVVQENLSRLFATLKTIPRSVDIDYASLMETFKESYSHESSKE